MKQWVDWAGVALIFNSHFANQKNKTASIKCSPFFIGRTMFIQAKDHDLQAPGTCPGIIVMFPELSLSHRHRRSRIVSRTVDRVAINRLWLISRWVCRLLLILVHRLLMSWIGWLWLISIVLITVVLGPRRSASSTTVSTTTLASACTADATCIVVEQPVKPLVEVLSLIHI